MSLFVETTATCGQCGATAPAKLVASVNGDRRADLRDEILEGTFQAQHCPACETLMRLPSHLSYLDMGRGQWILAEDPAAIGDWREIEADAQAIFERTYGADAPEAARAIGAGLRPRLVFGWPALREALVADDLGLDPVLLEMLKLAVMRGIPGAPIEGRNELRLVGGELDLEFEWVDGVTEEVAAGLPVPWALYEQIAGDPVAWAPLMAGLEGRFFKDLRRLMLV